MSKSYQYPELKLFDSKIDQTLINNAFQTVKGLPLCWIAYEELDLHFGAVFSRNAIDCVKNQDSISFVDSVFKKNLAAIYFDRSLNIFEPRQGKF